MRVLVMENEAGGAVEAVDRLEAAGHEVVRCHEAGEPAFPCAGLHDGVGCPLDKAPIDVAVIAGDEPAGSTAPTSEESGAICAVRRFVPVVLLGSPRTSALSPYATSSVTGPEAVVAAAEHAAAAAPPRHAAAAEACVREVLQIHEMEHVGVDVSVVRRAGVVTVRLHASEPLDAKLRDVLAIRVVAAIRVFDHDAQTVDVTVEDAMGGLA